jgi:hypothetical protein
MMTRHQKRLRTKHDRAAVWVSVLITVALVIAAILLH